MRDAVNRGVSNEQLAAEETQILESAGERARNNLKVQFLLTEIAEAEKLKVEDQELIQAITSLAKRENKPVKAFMKQMQRERRIDSLRSQMLVGKTVDFLLEKTNFIEVEPTENDNESESND